MRRATAAAGAVAAAVALAAAAGIPAVALAAPPANDGPDGAVELLPFSAENGEPSELQGTADLREATADAGVPRCLGRGSFERTVWFRMPAADAPQRVRLAALTKAGEPADLPDLAAFVQPAGRVNTAEPQACDGPAARPASAVVDGAPTVVLDVPAGRAVLVQAGWSARATADELVVSADADPLPVAKAPAGDRATRAPRLAHGRFGRLELSGALLSAEDPAQPACPAAATVWRRVKVRRGGRQTAVVRGPGVSSLTAFSRPTGRRAKACAVRGRRDAIRTRFRARKGQVVWLRVGTDALEPGRARLGLFARGDVPGRKSRGRR